MNNALAELQRVYDPSEPSSFVKGKIPIDFSSDAFDYLGFPPLNPVRQWLYEHRRNLDKKPYVNLDKNGNPVLRKGLEVLYPGLADKIRKSKETGYSDNEIMAKIIDKVGQSISAGFSDEEIENKLYEREYDYGAFEPIKAYIKHGLTTPEKGLGYVNQKTIEDWSRYAAGHYTEWEMALPAPPKEKVKTKEELERTAESAEIRAYYAQRFVDYLSEFTAVVAKGYGGLTFGVGPAVQEIIGGKEIPKPKTIPGVIVGETAALAGFILGPLKASQWLIGSRLMPTATGLRGVAQMMRQGGATLGLASGTSSIIPSLQQSDTLTEAGFNIFNQTAGATITGALYPLAGAIESKPLRLAVGLAVADKLRAGSKEWFTIDDVFRGISDGTIDRTDLAERAYGYLLDIYFISKVPSMRKQLAGFEKNALIKEMMNVNPVEAEQMIIKLGREGLIPGIDAKYLNGLKDIEINRMFGSQKNFEQAFRAMNLNQVQLALELIKEGKISPRPSDTRVRILSDAIKTERMFNQADAELRMLYDGRSKKLRQRIATAIWDTSANIKAKLIDEGGDLGKQAAIRHDLIRGASMKADKMLGDASDKIYKGLSKSEHIQLDRIIQSRRTIAIDKYKKGIKHPAGLGGKEHQGYLDSLPKETVERLNQRADTYFAEMKNQLTQLYKAGLLTKQSYEELQKTGDYSPRRFIQYIDPDIAYTGLAGKKITVPDSGLMRLDEGSYRALENNSQMLLGQVIGRTQSRIFRNEANKAVWALVEQIPDNGIVKKAKIIRTTKTGKPIYQKTPAGFEKVKVVIEGQAKEMLMLTELAAEWVTTNPAVTQQWMNVMGWLSGARILRPMATGLNPEFAVTNMPRDMAHAWLVTGEYSPHAPVAIGQMARDFAAVAKDTFSRRGRWFDYIDQGGGMSFLTHQGGGGLARGKAGRIEPLRKALGYIGETSEIWTRLALRERALRNGKEPYQATWEARNYLDFSQGGSFIKGMDSFVPYLNAGVQGTRGIFRAAKEKPAIFAYKMAQVGTLSSGIYLANRYVNPECWAAVSDYDKANYFIITTPITYNDEDGQERHLYFRVAKDQGQKLTCTLFESMTAKMQGEEIDIDQAVMAAKDFITIVPTELVPPTVEALVGYACNEDFWRKEEIWKGPDILPQEEYRSYTHPAFVKLGTIDFPVFGHLSPERTQAALEQFFTRNNIYTSGVGLGLRQIMDELPIDVKDETTTEMLRQAPFLRRLLKATDPYSEHRKNLEEAKKEESTRKFVINREMDALSEQFYADKINKRQVRQFINNQPWQDRSGLIQRHQRYGKFYEISDRTWWLNLSYLPAETRAVVYWTRYMQSTVKEQEILENTLKKLPLIISGRFYYKLNQLRKTKEREE